MLNIIFTVIGLIIILLLWVMLFDSNRFVTVSYKVSDTRIRKDFRVVVLADLHNKSFGKKNAALLEAIHDCKPDMILVAGDILTAKKGKKPNVAIDLMAELVKEYPCYYGNGNHEHRLKLYPKTYGNMAEVYENALQKIGISRLVNTHVKLAEYGVNIYGAEIDRYYYKRFRVPKMAADYLPSVLGEIDKSAYNILIAHNPDFFPNYAAWGADMVFAGHVHGGIIRIPIWGKGVASPNIRLFPKYDGGEFSEGESKMILSRGLGLHTIPFRLFNPGELVVVDFAANKSSS